MGTPEPSDLSSSPLLPTLISDDQGSGCSNTETMGVDEMLQCHVGEFGPWQLRHLVLTSLAWALNALQTLVIVFADREPSWNCTTTPTPCPSTTCTLPPGEWKWSGAQGSSTVSEWGLVCNLKYMVGFSQSAFFAGSLIGAGLFGHLSDFYLGRRGTLMAACSINASFGLLTALSPSFPIYTLLRFLTGLSTGGVGLSAFVLTTEPVGPTKRGAVAMSTFFFFSLGTILLSLVAAPFHSSWRALYVVTSLPSLLFVAAVLPFVSESPRWYLVHGKNSHAMDVMRSIAKGNGRTIPEGASLMLDNRSHGQVSYKGSNSKNSIMDVIRSPVTRTRLVLAVAVNLLSSVPYYGLTLNVGNLGTELHWSVILNAVAEMPAYALTAWLLKWYGRRPLTVGTLWLCAGFCIVGGLVGAALMRTVCGVVGIFAVTGTFSLVYVYAAELFPTAVRNVALGCVTQAGQAGAVLAPMVVVLGGGWPFGVFGACAVAGGMLALYLPETLDAPLYDTMYGLISGEGTVK